MSSKADTSKSDKGNGSHTLGTKKHTHLNEASVENPFGPCMLVTSGQRQNPAVQKTRFRQIMSKGHSHSNRKMDPDPITSKLVPHWSSTKSLLVGHVNSICQKHVSYIAEPTRK